MKVCLAEAGIEEMRGDVLRSDDAAWAGFDINNQS